MWEPKKKGGKITFIVWWNSIVVHRYTSFCDIKDALILGFNKLLSLPFNYIIHNFLWEVGEGIDVIYINTNDSLH